MDIAKKVFTVLLYMAGIFILLIIYMFGILEEKEDEYEKEGPYLFIFHRISTFICLTLPYVAIIAGLYKAKVVLIILERLFSLIFNGLFSAVIMILLYVVILAIAYFLALRDDDEDHYFLIVRQTCVFICMAIPFIIMIAGLYIYKPILIFVSIPFFIVNILIILKVKNNSAVEFFRRCIRFFFSSLMHFIRCIYILLFLTSFFLVSVKIVKPDTLWTIKTNIEKYVDDNKYKSKVNAAIENFKEDFSQMDKTWNIEYGFKYSNLESVNLDMINNYSQNISIKVNEKACFNNEGKEFKVSGKAPSCVKVEIISAYNGMMNYNISALMPGEGDIVFTLVDSERNDIYDIISFHVTVSSSDETIVALGEHLYRYYDVPISWGEAVTCCSEQGGHLLTINDESEQALMDYLSIRESNKKYIWLGGYINQEYNWTWIDNSSFDYTNWEDNNPDTNDGDKIFIRYKVVKESSQEKIHGKWENTADVNNYSEHPELMADYGFICEWDDRQSYISTVKN